MTIQYYIGGKIVGLAADTKPTSVPANTTFIESDTFTEFIFDGDVTWNQIGAPPAAVGGWKELGRTTLGVSGSTIDVSGLDDKRYYQILSYYDASVDNSIRFNGVSSTTYANRRSDNGSESSQINQDKITLNASAGGTLARFTNGYIANLSTKEKLAQFWTNVQGTAGAATAPTRTEAVGKHAQTVNPIDQMTIVNTGGSFPSGAELVVLEWDPADTHTDNFWEELASVDLSGGAADNLNSGTFVAKKYLWVQAFMEADGGLITGNSTFNGDTAGNYARRRQSNGAADNTAGNETAIDVRGGENKNRFDNMFIVNNSANEKLVIGNLVVNPPASGAGVVPDRVEYVAKWANTSSQITSINYANTDAGSYGTASIIKVWGSD